MFECFVCFDCFDVCCIGHFVCVFCIYVNFNFNAILAMMLGSAIGFPMQTHIASESCCSLWLLATSTLILLYTVCVSYRTISSIVHVFSSPAGGRRAGAAAPHGSPRRPHMGEPHMGLEPPVYNTMYTLYTI